MDGQDGCTVVIWYIPSEDGESKHIKRYVCFFGQKSLLINFENRPWIHKTINSEDCKGMIANFVDAKAVILFFCLGPNTKKAQSLGYELFSTSISIGIIMDYSSALILCL